MSCRLLKSTSSKVATTKSRIAKVSGAIQAALMNTLRVPPEDFYQLIFDSRRIDFSIRLRSSECITRTI